MPTTRTRFRNTTDKGNVKEIHILVTDTPHATAGKAHASVEHHFRSGGVNVATGGYHATREAAEAKAAEYVAAAAKNPGLARMED